MNASNTSSYASTLLPLLLKTVSAACGIAILLLSLLNQVTPQTAYTLLGLGLSSLAISTLKH